MAKMTFSSDNKKSTNFDFPKLHLDHGERARIVCIEQEPEVNFVHTLKAPTIVNGEVVMESVKNKDGSFTEKPKMEFVGRHLCFGNMNTLMEKGKDPQNCPTCAAAQDNDCIGEAVRRFAMHVVQYKVQPGKFQPQTPFQADLVVWAFTDRMFSQLTDIAEEHGDLRQKDLLLGPCENKMFQNFDIQVGGSAAWLENDANKELVKTLYAENKLDDLDPAIGRKVGKDSAQEDIQKVLLKNQQAFGGGSSNAGQQASVSQQTMDLSGLLGEQPNEATTVASTPEPEVEAPVAEFKTEPATVESEPAKQEEKSTLNFDELLSGL